MQRATVGRYPNSLRSRDQASGIRPYIQDDRAVLDYRHLRDNLSRNVQAFRRDTIRLARLRHQHRTHGLNTWMIHG